MRLLCGLSFGIARTVLPSKPEANLQLFEESVNAALDLVADGADGGDVLAGGVVEDRLLVTLAREDGHASPPPMVMTTSAAFTVSSVQGLGNSVEMSMMPRSAMR